MGEAIQTGEAPGAVGPYSQAVRAGQLVFCAGQVGLDPSSGDMVDGGVVEQATRALKNLKAVLEAAGLGLDRVVKTTVFLKSMSDFVPMNDVYAGFFSIPYPARSTVAVAELPKGALVEIEAVAFDG